MHPPLSCVARDVLSEDFPDVKEALAEPNGLLAVGGDLSSARLLSAYRRGIFPWYSEDQPILWWSPDPRCVLFPKNLKVSRSLRATLRKNRFQVSMDRAFRQVMGECAGPRRGQPGTWVTPDLIEAYDGLHRLGYAHSVESWRDGRLVGGLYGVALGRVFFGESMFAQEADASKVCLVHLVSHLRDREFTLIDCQVPSPHLESLGAVTIPRQRFIDMLKDWCA
ncbi:MAG TPA: leucyl/phenylalanyl-tRNA--protein transferase [Candidatus Methylomirabilis sp.]|nr:leucyl/phenylalanyl-tRNA--protein transferase [Candidatus Methylomirabilis sp.]